MLRYNTNHTFTHHRIASAWRNLLKFQRRAGTTMFLIKKVYENDLTALLKIEGEITDATLDDWAVALGSLLEQTHKHVILDCCDVTFVSSKIAERLLLQMTNRIFLLNCPTTVQNLVRAAGFSEQVLV